MPPAWPYLSKQKGEAGMASPFIYAEVYGYFSQKCNYYTNE